MADTRLIEEIQGKIAIDPPIQWGEWHERGGHFEAEPEPSKDRLGLGDVALALVQREHVVQQGILIHMDLTAVTAAETDRSYYLENLTRKVAQLIGVFGTTHQFDGTLTIHESFSWELTVDGTTVSRKATVVPEGYTVVWPDDADPYMIET